MRSTAQSANALTGLIHEIVYRNEETGYSVMKVRPDGNRFDDAPEILVGVCVCPSVGERIAAKGEWKRDSRFGLQFAAVQVETTPPTTVEGIEKYLGSGQIPNVGPVCARKLVQAFGEDVFKVIENESTRLETVDGIGPDRRRSIRDAWMSQKSIRDIMVFLHSNGVGSARAQKIFKKYGDEAIEKISQNPFRLADEVDGIGFKIADEMAKRLGVPLDSTYRVASGIRHALREAAGSGHTAVPREILITKCCDALSVDDEVLNKVIEAKLNARELIAEDGDCQMIYLPHLYRAEINVAQCIHRITHSSDNWPTFEANECLDQVEYDTGMKLAPAQREAISTILSSRFSVVTGGPGVGKSTILLSLLKIVKRRRIEVLLAAPTGRAAKRMSEVTGIEAKTVHRLLGVNGETGDFIRNDENPLFGDLLVVDEASMMDILLMDSLLQAVPSRMRVVLIGDVDQLPSVGPGSVLKDVISSDKVPVVRLTQVFRQAAESRIITGAHDINHGTIPTNGGDFFFMNEEDPALIAEKVADLVTVRLPKKYGYNPLTDIQVLTPMHGGAMGTSALNQELHNRLTSPNVPFVKRGERRFRVGDKVIQTKNNYDLDVFNGDIGVIQDIDGEEKKVRIAFDARQVVMKYTDMSDLQHAYAITIHKSQGSEFPVVVIPLHTQHFVMLQRNLLYTGVTRGKKLVVLVGSTRAISAAVTRIDVARRYSCLRDRIRELPF